MKPILKKLKNGMTVILMPQKGAASMTIEVLVRVGSRYETKEINGASHFIEHLMFKGTKKRPDTLSISKELDRYGAEYNAFTGKDYTGYYIKMDANKTPLAVDMLHDMIFHSKYEQKEMNRERGVIIEEINMYEDNPRMHIEDLLEEALYPNHKLGWNIAGPREVIKNVTREQLVTYRDRYYIPSRMTIVVAGKLLPNVFGLLEKTFGKAKQPVVPKDEAFETFCTPLALEKPIALQHKKTEQVQLGMAFHGLPYGDKRIPAATLLGTILGGTMSSRLFIQVREKRGLCYSINASHQSYEDTGLFSVMSGLEKTRLHEAVKVIWQELKRTTKELVSPEELRRAKDHLSGRLTLAFEDSATQADWYAKQWMFQSKAATPEERIKQIEKVTAADIREVAKLLFRTEHMAASVIGPFEDKSVVEKMFVLA
jgi:predicted Zn-dependent peptidase